MPDEELERALIHLRDNPHYEVLVGRLTLRWKTNTENAVLREHSSDWLRGRAAETHDILKIMTAKTNR